MNRSGKLHALAATARIANIPSVACNVFLGIAMAVGLGSGISPGPAVVLIASGTCLYLAGNFLNDWADRDWDASHRPERALPRGLFPPRLYLFTAAGCGLLGLGLAAAVNWLCLLVAWVIAVSILDYTRSHKRCAWSFIPMGLCRAMLPLLGFCGFPGEIGLAPAVAACGVGLFCHIAGLSLSARCESAESCQPGLLRFTRLWFLPAALAMVYAAWHGLSCPLPAAIFGLLPYAAWIALCLTIYRKPVSAYVSGLLAGIPLVDGIVLLPLAVTLAADGWSAFPVMCALVPPLAFCAALALQRLAPAT